MSQKLGLSAEGFQKWDYVLKIAGTDINSMQTGLKTLTNKLDDAKNGSSKAQEMFAKLGISMEELQTMSREEAFEAAIKGFQGLEDSTERAALANDLFGRSGQELTPLFNQTAEATEEQMKLAEKYGMVMPESAVKASAAFQDSLTTMSMTMSGFKNRLMGEFLPAITDVTDGLSQIFAGDLSGADKVVEGIENIVKSIGDKLPEFAELGSKIVSGLAKALLNGAPLLFREGTKLITDLGTQFIKKLPEIVSVGTNIITSVLDGISEAIPGLIEAMPYIITSLVTSLAENLPKLVASGGKLLMGIVEGVIKAIPILVKQAPTIIGQFVKGIIGMWEAVKQSGKQIIDKLIEGISNMWKNLKEKVISFAKQIPTYIKNALTGLANIGRDIVTGLWNGISDKARWLKDQISGWIGNVKSFLKNLFGISSPSKWARDIIGGNIVKGLAMGLEQGEDLIQKSFDDLMPSYDGDYTMNVDRPASSSGVSIVNYITVDGAENPEDFTDRFVRRLRMDMRMV